MVMDKILVVIAQSQMVTVQSHADPMESKYRPPTIIAIERTIRATSSLRLTSPTSSSRTRYRTGSVYRLEGACPLGVNRHCLPRARNSLSDGGVIKIFKGVGQGIRTHPDPLKALAGVNLAAMSMHDIADRSGRTFEHAVRGGIGNHDCSEPVRKAIGFDTQILKINQRSPVGMTIWSSVPKIP
jgi:hypothetical protein